MNELKALASSIRELIVQEIEKGDFAMASYNLRNLKDSVTRRLQPGTPQYKTGSRSAMADVYSPFHAKYQRLSECFQQLETLLDKRDQEASLAKAQEAINILDSQ